MRERRTSGSARGARSNPRPYRDRGRKANAPAFPGIRIPLKAEPPEPVPIWALLDVRAHHLDIGTGSPCLAALSLR